MLTSATGVILGHVLGARNGDTAAVSRGGAAGFTGIFQIVATDKAGGGRLKKGPICAAGHRLLPPSHPSPPLLPDLPSPSLLAQEGEGAREWWSTIVSAKPTIPTSPVCCPLWPGTTRQQGRWRHRADRGRLRPLPSARGIPCALDGGTRSSSQCEPMHRWSLLSVNAPRRHPVCIRQIAAVLTGQVRYSGGGADAARLQPARWPLLVSAPLHHLQNRVMMSPATLLTSSC